jgi:DNA repair protein RadC
MQPRERYAEEGPSRFGDVELLALALGTGVAGHSSTAIAAELIDRFGHLGAVAQAEVAALASQTGIGAARAVRLLAAIECGRRIGRARPPSGEPILSPQAAWNHLGPALRHLPEEELHALFLDRRRRPLGLRQLTRGCDAFTVVEPRQIFRVAVGLGAAAVILAHNHPSGDPTPSPQDRDVTRRVAIAGRSLGIPLLDHLVVGAEGYRSLAGEGELPRWPEPPPLTTGG